MLYLSQDLANGEMCEDSSVWRKGHANVVQGRQTHEGRSVSNQDL